MASWILDNPVITKELRGRMRGARTYWLLFGYLLLLSLILFFSYLGWWNQHSSEMERGGASAGFTVGRTFFEILFYSQAVMIALITPALTAGAISIEREQRTFEMLRGTTLRPSAIVWGKLASSVSFVALLLTSSLPLLSLCFLLGGVSPGEVFFAYILLVGDAFLFGAVGLCWSAYAASTATATVLSYATLIVFFVVTAPFAASVVLGNGSSPNTGLCALNPVGAVVGAVVPEHYYGWTLPAWVPALLLNGTLSAVLVLACINRLEDFPARRATPLRLVTLLFAGLIMFFGGGIMLGLSPALGASAPMQILGLLVIACLLLLLFVPVLVTGDTEGWAASTRRRSSLIGAWSPRRVFGDATLPSGPPLALLLTVLVLALTFLATRLSSLAPTALFGRPGAGAPPLRPAAALVAGVSGAQVTDTLLQASLMLVLVVLGIAGLGFLLSVLLGNRWSSLTLLYLTVVLAVALPFFSYALLSGRDADTAAHSPAVNSLYLCPFIPLYQLSDSLETHPTFGRDSIAATVGMAGYGVWPLWVGTGLLYLVIGLACYGFGLTILRRRSAPQPNTGKGGQLGKGEHGGSPLHDARPIRAARLEPLDCHCHLAHDRHIGGEDRLVVRVLRLKTYTGCLPVERLYCRFLAQKRHHDVAVPRRVLLAGDHDVAVPDARVPHRIPVDFQGEQIAPALVTAPQERGGDGQHLRALCLLCQDGGAARDAAQKRDADRPAHREPLTLFHQVQRALVAVAAQEAFRFQAVQVLLDGAGGAEADPRADLADRGRVAALLDMSANDFKNLPLLLSE